MFMGEGELAMANCSNGGVDAAEGKMIRSGVEIRGCTRGLIIMIHWHLRGELQEVQQKTMKCERHRSGGKTQKKCGWVTKSDDRQALYKEQD